MFLIRFLLNVIFVSDYNMWAAISSIHLTILGLGISIIVRYYSNIVKLFAQGSSMLISAILTYAIFGLNFTVTYILGLIVTVCAIILYKY